MKSSHRATFWAQNTDPVTYVRADLPARYLPGQVLHLQYDELVDDGRGGVAFRRQKGAAIWSFPGHPNRGLIMAEMQEQGIPVLIEADDNYLVHPPYRTGSWQQKYDSRASGNHSYGAFRRFLKWVDGVIVSTPYLADLYGRFNQNVHVCPNSVDPADWPDAPHQEDGILRIGWAASNSHAPDAPLVYRALDWASRQPDVKVVIFGIDPRLTGFRFEHEHLEWTSWLHDYRCKLVNIDLMLCPGKDGHWHRGKSDVKCLEATMGGAASVVSEVEPFRPWFDRTHTCRTDEDFLKVVKHLVHNRDEVASLYEQAREYVLEERTIEGNIHKWHEALGVTDELVGVRRDGVRGRTRPIWLRPVQDRETV